MIELTIFTSKTSLCKIISLDPDGNLVKKAGASLKDGAAERVTVQNLSEFSELHRRLTSHQALAYGVFKGPPKRPVTLDAYRAMSSSPVDLQ